MREKAGLGHKAGTDTVLDTPKLHLFRGECLRLGLSGCSVGWYFPPWERQVEYSSILNF
jgi:hypothetical protein